MYVLPAIKARIDVSVSRDIIVKGSHLVISELFLFLWGKLENPLKFNPFSPLHFTFSLLYVFLYFRRVWRGVLSFSLVELLAFSRPDYTEIFEFELILSARLKLGAIHSVNLPFEMRMNLIAWKWFKFSHYSNFHRTFHGDLDSKMNQWFVSATAFWEFQFRDVFKLFFLMLGRVHGEDKFVHFLALLSWVLNFTFHLTLNKILCNFFFFWWWKNCPIVCHFSSLRRSFTE